MNYTLASATEVLRKHGGVVISGKGIAYTPGAVGIKVLGAIDYLVNTHHYHMTVTVKAK